MRRSLTPVVLATALLAASGCMFGAPKLDLEVVNDLAREVQVVYEWGDRADERATLTVVPSGGAAVTFDRPSAEWRLLVDGIEVTGSHAWPSDNPVIDLTIQIDAEGNASVLDR